MAVAQVVHWKKTKKKRRKTTTQYGRHFGYLFIFAPLCSVCSRIRRLFFFRFCFAYFVSAFHISFGLPWRVFLFLFIFMRRRRRHHAPLTQFYASASRAIFVSFFIYISKALKNRPTKKAKTNAFKTLSSTVKRFRCQSCVNYAIKLSFTLFSYSMQNASHPNRQRNPKAKPS